MTGKDFLTIKDISEDAFSDGILIPEWRLIELLEEYHSTASNSNAPMRVFKDRKEIFDFSWDKSNNTVTID